MLHAAAKQASEVHAGAVPSEVSDLRKLAGIGAYTAGAVASIAFGRRAAVVDGNVARVLSRLFAVEDDIKSARGNALVWRLAEVLVPEGDGDPGDWNQALMELGATVCVPRAPKMRRLPGSRSLRRQAPGDRRHALPRSTPKRPPLAVRRVAIVLASARAVVLARRRGNALFGGMWEAPTADGEMATLAARLGIEANELERAGEVVHILSHRRMQIEVARASARA